MAANEGQIEYWNGDAGNKWADAQIRLDRMLSPLTDPAIALADPQPGERVLDVGCGCGETTLAMLEQGAVVRGIDLSEMMLDRARERTKAYGSVAFDQADASVQTFEPEHALVFSRFGVMFFDDPVAAFANLRTALLPSGRLVFLCWQTPRDNAWIHVAGKAIQPFLPQPEEPVDPHAPGPFAFADPEYLTGLLEDAGFADVNLDSVKRDLHLADTLDEAIEFQGQIGPVARALAELEGEQKAAALDAARSALSSYVTESGIELGGAVWLVSAKI